jgi:hypothetical protein
MRRVMVGLPAFGAPALGHEGDHELKRDEASDQPDDAAVEEEPVPHDHRSLASVSWGEDAPGRVSAA